MVRVPVASPSGVLQEACEHLNTGSLLVVNGSLTSHFVNFFSWSNDMQSNKMLGSGGQPWLPGSCTVTRENSQCSRASSICWLLCFRIPSCL